MLLDVGPAWVQAQRPNLSVAPTVTAEPASQIAFPIRVEPAGALPRSSFVRLRGLPPMAALSDGHSIAPGSWAVPIAALPNLKITLPATSTGTSEISITLVNIDGSVLVETNSTLVVAAPARPSGVTSGQAAAARDTGPPISILRAGTPLQVIPERVERSPPPPPLSAAPTMTPQDRERALRLMKKGDEQLAEGNVAQARLLYERAADAGLALGAMQLAGTYDGAELGRLGVRGLQADRDAARKWYERARQLGAAEADQRLRRLGAN